MSWIALRMLTGDRNKYLGLIFGVGTFSAVSTWRANNRHNGRQAVSGDTAPSASGLRWRERKKSRFFPVCANLRTRDCQESGGVLCVSPHNAIYSEPWRTKMRTGTACCRASPHFCF
jgi:hypothetical protein